MTNTLNIVSRQSNLQKCIKPREFRETPFGTILSQALFGKVQRLSRNGVHSSEWKCEAPVLQGDDIVSSIWQHIAVHKRTHKEQRPLWKILDIQARLYWRLIRQTMDKDDYFKDFMLVDFRFIVVNNIDNPTPVVWLFPKTQAVGTVVIGGKKLRDPEVIGKELTYYLDHHPSVPLGIALDKPNNIERWFDDKQ